MACSADCKHPSPSQAHCGAAGCHRTFGGVGPFDRHWQNGRCLDPAEIAGLRLAAGVWRGPGIADAERWWIRNHAS